MANRILKSFKIRSGSKLLDYRSGEKLNLSKIKSFFQGKFNVKKIWQGSRHVLGVLNRDNKDYFLKLSTSKGISLVTRNEYGWNDYFNKYFPRNYPFQVPRNYDCGLYENIFFYLITDYLDGKLLCDINESATQLTSYTENIILLSELIQQMPRLKFSTLSDKGDFRQKFTEKVNKWFDDSPAGIRKQYKVGNLLKIVEEGVDDLTSRSRHGDFTPWHMILLKNKKLGLIDGEHARSDGVEGYDICYFLQRVFSVLKDPLLAQNIYSQLLAKGYEKNKLKTVLAARAIGGFLDESLRDEPNYKFANNFKDWVIQN